MSKKHDQLPALREYVKSLDARERSALERTTGTTCEYLLMCAGGHRRPGYSLTKRIAHYTGIPREQIRPDIYGDPPEAA